MRRAKNTKSAAGVFSEEPPNSNVENLKERCVFVLATLGLSISQLLGQNDPAIRDKVRYAIQIFDDFVDAHGLNPHLKTRFKQFNYFYNGCRHFGKTTGGAGYTRIDELTFPVAKECFEFGMEVWKTVIGVHRKEDESKLDELDLDEFSTSVD